MNYSDDTNNILYSGITSFTRQKTANETYRSILKYCKKHGHTPTRKALAKWMKIPIGSINGRINLLKKDNRITFDDRNGQMIVVETDA